MKLLLARTVLAGSILGLTGCAAFDWWPQSTAKADVKTQQSADNTAGGPAIYPRAPDGGSTVTASSTETSAAAVATAPAPDVAAPVAATGLDSATMVDMLGMAWQGLQRPQPVDPAISKYLGGFGVVVDMLQRGFDARAAREAHAGIARLRDAMGPGETKIIHIRQAADGRVQVVEVPGRFTPIAKNPGEKVIESEIVTPEVVVERDGSLLHIFTSKGALTQKARASYDQEWPAFYKRSDAAITAILARG
ncbi:hypothetical protein SOM61_11850 [Massilia sp. CFBP9012]|uniref:hypothetical protein n=1 Tax=Massilia sp. CFBP9012 TaxID=3096531 RepID=UPI002A69B2BB|nr:hypothetical protein [Massilia sp. CFBP9012]MDY0975664.1 hypothetical protein [Massilia sp. CFBP9012]